jgi:uncharacterized protein YkwD
MRKLLLSLSAIALLQPIRAEFDTSEKLIAELQICMKSGKSTEELVDSLEDLPAEEMKKLIPILEKAWPKIRDPYLTALQGAAKSFNSGPAKNKNQARIRELREDFQAVYKLDENAMKPLLKSKSMPAVEELRKLMLPEPEQLIKAGGEKLAQLRHSATELATFRDAALETDLSTIEVDAVSTLQAAEKQAAEDISSLPKDALRILANNAKIAIKEEVPEQEVKGVEECNLWRLLVGLNACELDPKLCESARDHSKDMAEKGFFAHESPVPGKTTPWDRAKNFDTTASGENIHMGSSDFHGANSGWFYSPGHHKNMFNAGQRRIGLGQHNTHWTQLFGR